MLVCHLSVLSYRGHLSGKYILLVYVIAMMYWDKVLAHPTRS